MLATSVPAIPCTCEVKEFLLPRLLGKREPVATAGDVATTFHIMSMGASFGRDSLPPSAAAGDFVITFHIVSMGSYFGPGAE